MTSSVIITCTYTFTADDDHLQNQQYWVSLYNSSGHDINPSFTHFVPKIDQEIIWDFCVIRLLYPVSAHNLIIYFISFEELSCIDYQNVGQYTLKTSQYFFTNKPSRMVEIVGIRNDAIHERIPGHQLFFCDKKLFHICTYLTINELIFHWAQCLSVSTPAIINGG